MFVNWIKNFDLFYNQFQKYDKLSQIISLIRRNTDQCTENLSSCTTPSSKSSTSGEFLLPNIQEQITPLEIINDQVDIVTHKELDTTKT